MLLPLCSVLHVMELKTNYQIGEKIKRTTETVFTKVDMNKLNEDNNDTEPSHYNMATNQY